MASGPQDRKTPGRMTPGPQAPRSAILIEQDPGILVTDTAACYDATSSRGCYK